MQYNAVHRLLLLRPAVLALAVLVLQGPALAQDNGIVTDRPDFVESSNVVGLGRLQVETSLAVDRNRSAALRERIVSTPTLLRYGVSDTLELRFESEGRIVSRSRMQGSGERDRESGYADAAVGVKWHMTDAVGTSPSLALLVHADAPSGSRTLRGEKWRPSLRMVAEWDLPADLSLGVMPGVASNTDGMGQRYTHGIFGAVLGRQLTDKMRGFVEIAAPQVARSRHGGTQATLDVGGAYLLSDALQVDAMLARGLNSRTSDLSLTVGLSFKL